MNELGKNINLKVLKIILQIISIVSFVAMIVIPYDVEFKSTTILPIFYLLTISFVAKNEISGIGTLAVILVYAFRMCILPIICAIGNFYLEPSKSIYIEYYFEAIILMCVENAIVFVSLVYYNKKRLCHSYRGTYKVRANGNLLNAISVITIFAFVLLIVANPDFMGMFHLASFDIASADSIQETYGTLQNLGYKYYLFALFVIFARPIISFFLTYKLLKFDNMFATLLAICISVMNIFIYTDRRIYSLLIGGICMIQIIFHFRKRMTKKVFILVLVLLVVLTLFYSFMGEDTPYRIARKFQRYFSGPTLTAIGIAVNQRFFQGPIVFLKLLFNNSFILSGLFGSFEVPNRVIELCGSAGKSIWTPMTIGSIQYFSILFPVVLILVTKFVVKLDEVASEFGRNDMKIMLLNYMSLSLAVYMIMYSVELVIYNLCFFCLVYLPLIKCDSKIYIGFGKRRKVCGEKGFSTYVPCKKM